MAILHNNNNSEEDEIKGIWWWSYLSKQIDKGEKGNETRGLISAIKKDDSTYAF